MSPLQNMVNYSGKCDYNADEIIYLKGQEGKELFVVIRGIVGVYSYSVGGDPVKVNEIAEGGYFGADCLLDECTRQETIVAETDCILISVTKTTLTNFLQAYPDISLSIIREMISEKKSLLSQIEKAKLNERENTPVVKDVKRQIKANVSLDVPFPKENISFAKMAKIEDSNVIIHTERTCPVCQKRFKAVVPQISKLVPETVDNFLKNVYAEGDLPLYSVLVCPECNFAYLYDDPVKVSDNEKRKLLEESIRTNRKAFSGYSKIRMYDEAVEAFYHAIYCYGFLEKTSKQTFAKLWLNICWLYKACNETDRYMAAVLKAIKYFNGAYIESLSKLSEKEEMEYNLILGQLNLEANRKRVAKKHFERVVEIGSAVRCAEVILNTAKDNLYTMNQKNIKNGG